MNTKIGLPKELGLQCVTNRFNEEEMVLLFNGEVLVKPYAENITGNEANKVINEYVNQIRQSTKIKLTRGTGYNKDWFETPLSEEDKEVLKNLPKEQTDKSILNKPEYR